MADITPAGVNPIGISSATGTQINPATYEKQIEGITYLEGIAGEDYDTITVTYPSDTQEVYTYTLAAATVKVTTVNYTTATKDILSSIVKS